MGKCFPLSGFMFLPSMVPNGQSLVCFDRPMACLLKQTPSAVPTASLRTSIGGGIGWNDVSTNCLVPGAGCCNCRKIHWQTKSSTGMKGAPLRWLFPVSIFHVCYFHLSILWDPLLLVDLVGSRFPRCHRCWYTWHTTTSTCGEFVEESEESQCWHKYHKYLSIIIHPSKRVYQYVMWVSLAGPPGLALHLVEHQHCKVPGLWCGGSQDRGVRHHILRFAKDVNPKTVQTWTWHARPSRKSISTWTSNIYIYIDIIYI